MIPVLCARMTRTSLPSWSSGSRCRGLTISGDVMRKERSMWYTEAKDLYILWLFSEKQECIGNSGFAFFCTEHFWFLVNVQTIPGLYLIKSYCALMLQGVTGPSLFQTGVFKNGATPSHHPLGVSLKWNSDWFVESPKWSSLQFANSTRYYKMTSGDQEAKSTALSCGRFVFAESLAGDHWSAVVQGSYTRNSHTVSVRVPWTYPSMSRIWMNPGNWLHMSKDWRLQDGSSVFKLLYPPHLDVA